MYPMPTKIRMYSPTKTAGGGLTVKKNFAWSAGGMRKAKRGVDYRQDAGELGFAKEERNQPGKWKQQSDSDEEGGEHRGPQFMYTSLDSQWSQQEAENKAQPKQDCQYSLCSAERRNCLG